MKCIICAGCYKTVQIERKSLFVNIVRYGLCYLFLKWSPKLISQKPSRSIKYLTFSLTFIIVTFQYPAKQLDLENTLLHAFNRQYDKISIFHDFR